MAQVTTSTNSRGSDAVTDPRRQGGDGVHLITVSAPLMPVTDPPSASPPDASPIDEMSVKELKTMITGAGLQFTDCIEKQDLHARARESRQEVKTITKVAREAAPPQDIRRCFAL